MHKHKSFKQILGTGSAGLAHLRRQVTNQHQIDNLVRRHLPPELSQHCTGLLINGKSELVFILDNANWATHFRFMAGDMLNSLRKDPALAKITKIRCRVDKSYEEVPAVPARAKSRPAMNSNNADMINAVANDFANDDPLAQALKRLAKNTVKK